METAKILYKLDKICDRLIENEELLTELDRRIGDGDHGINVKRGFSEIKKALPTYEGKTVKEIFNGKVFRNSFEKKWKDELQNKIIENGNNGFALISLGNHLYHYLDFQ